MPSSPRLLVPVLAGGVRIDLSLDPSLTELAAELEMLWAHALAPGDDAGHRIEIDPAGASAGQPLESPHRRISVDPHSPGASYAVSGAMTLTAISAHIGSRILLHAGTVDIPGVGTVVVVGPSGAGKSTATTALAGRGAYLTDELTIIDPAEHTVTAFPKPVSQRAADIGEPASGAANPMRLPPKVDVPLAADGLTPADSAGPVDHVIVLDRQRDRGDGILPDPEAFSAARMPVPEAVLTLVNQSSSIWALPGGLSAVLALLARVGGALTVAYTEAAVFAERIGEIAEVPPEEITWEPVPAGSESSAPTPGQYATAPFSEAALVDGTLLILSEGQAVALSGISALVWDVLDQIGPSTPAQIEAEVVAAIGENPESAALIGQALDALDEESLLVIGDELAMVGDEEEI